MVCKEERRGKVFPLKFFTTRSVSFKKILKQMVGVFNIIERVIVQKTEKLLLRAIRIHRFSSEMCNNKEKKCSGGTGWLLS